MSEHVSVSIPKRLYDEIKKKVDESLGGFKSVDEYIEFVLTEILREEETVEDLTGERQKKLSYV